MYKAFASCTTVTAEASSWPLGKPGSLAEDEITTIDAVLDFYGDKTAQWLSELTHREQPWLEARSGLRDGERGERVISLASMAEYYSSL